LTDGWRHWWLLGLFCPTGEITGEEIEFQHKAGIILSKKVVYALHRTKDRPKNGGFFATLKEVKGAATAVSLLTRPRVLKA
jgi:hypothetical protein